MRRRRPLYEMLGQVCVQAQGHQGRQRVYAVGITRYLRHALSSSADLLVLPSACCRATSGNMRRRRPLYEMLGQVCARVKGLLVTET
jgi:hypothetical protein